MVGNQYKRSGVPYTWVMVHVSFEMISETETATNTAFRINLFPCSLPDLTHGTIHVVNEGNDSHCWKYSFLGYFPHFGTVFNISFCHAGVVNIHKLQHWLHA